MSKKYQATEEALFQKMSTGFSIDKLVTMESMLAMTKTMASIAVMFVPVILLLAKRFCIYNSIRIRMMIVDVYQQPAHKGWLMKLFISIFDAFNSLHDYFKYLK